MKEVNRYRLLVGGLFLLAAYHNHLLGKDIFVGTGCVVGILYIIYGLKKD